MRYYIETLGCKVNQFESQAMAALLSEKGHEPVPLSSDCDICIINSCAVTGESGRKSRQAVRRCKRIAPGSFIALCGCWSQIAAEDAAELDVDYISGSADRGQFVNKILELIDEQRKEVSIDEPFKRKSFELLPAGSISGRTRAMMKIQDGCNNFCSYCIIPYARGALRSMSISDAAEQAKKLKDEGYLEIVVTGIEISSYGRDLKDGTTLIDVIEAIAKAAPGVRIHLGSLEPRTVTEEFAKRLSALSNICDHFHLSLQSGCDSVLSRMRRKYDTARYYESVQILRKYFKNCGITTDLIVGFPGETEDEFSETLSFIRRCAFSAMHIFPYSKRPGTPAADMPNQLDNNTKHERAVKAQEVCSEMTQEFLSSCVGKTFDVLFEHDDNGFLTGHSTNYVVVRASGTGLRGKIVPVTIFGVSDGELLGNISSKTI